MKNDVYRKIELGRMANFLEGVSELTSEEVNHLLSYLLVLDSEKEETIKEAKEKLGIKAIMEKYQK